MSREKRNEADAARTAMDRRWEQQAMLFLVSKRWDSRFIPDTHRVIDAIKTGDAQRIIHVLQALTDEESAAIPFVFNVLGTGLAHVGATVMDQTADMCDAQDAAKHN